MRESKKSQLTSILILLGIGILSVFLLFAINILAWPVGSEIGKIATVNPIPAKVPEGVILVTVLSNQTLVSPSTALLNGSGSNIISQPLAGLTVAISLGLAPPFVTNRTIANGQVEENVPPNVYSVKVLDWRLNNFTTTVTVLSNEITSLAVTLSATTYTIQEFHILDPDSTGFIVGWEQVYAHLPGNNSVVSQNPQTYLDTQMPPATPIQFFSNPRVVTPVVVGSEQAGNLSQWVQMQVKAPLSIGNIKTLSLLALSTSFVVNTSAIPVINNAIEPA
ncbi:MAG: hypothetical protein ACHQ1H_07260 [Nitrososphaerales archaeon]